MSLARRLSLLLTCNVVLVVGCAPPGPPAEEAGAVLSPEARAKLGPDALAALSSGAATQLLIAVDDLDARGATDGAAAAPSWPAAKADLAGVALGSGLALDDEWDQLPILPLTAPSLAELAPLLEDPRVISASLVQQFTTFDAESQPLINQPAAAAAGKLGTGTTVAVLDTGVDYTRAAFGCSAVGVPATCKVAVARDFATDDAALDSVGHGTNVAGIVLAVAPGARVLALDVFDGATASSATILAAYNWVLQNRATYNVAAVNLSLGGGRATTTCATDALAVAFQAGRNAGLITTVASGNDAAIDATSWPACAPAAVSVGAVYDANVGGLAFARCSDTTSAADMVACFSNSASFLTLLAPGALIDAAGYRMAGTSQAAPHVAGAVAVLRAAVPAETGDQLVTRLISGGKIVVDARSRRGTPRLDVYGALGLVAAPMTPLATKPPAISATFRTSSSRVYITWTASASSGIASYRLVGAPGATVPAEKCTVGATLSSGPDIGPGYVHGPLGLGATWSYRVCVTDRLGNTSPGAATTIVVRN